jgi:hypothetical protein
MTKMIRFAVQVSKLPFRERFARLCVPKGLAGRREFGGVEGGAGLSGALLVPAVVFLLRHRLVLVL